MKVHDHPASLLNAQPAKGQSAAERVARGLYAEVPNDDTPDEEAAFFASLVTTKLSDLEPVSDLSAEERVRLGLVEAEPFLTPEELDAFYASRVKVRLSDLKTAKAHAKP
jgi:hypothetical protein